jgi:YidC/Oxa1 family membrane protein insertase
VLVLRAILHPVTRWSTKSMLEMQKLQPKMQEIREKHADDKERMQQEMSKIGGFKAFTGCLPMFVQMPIWIALYGALGAAISLRHAAFIPADWLPGGTPFSMFLQDLSAPDMLVHWQTPFFMPGRDIPLLGWLMGGLQSMLAGGAGGITSFNLLPILVGGSMYLQQLVTPQPAAATANPQSAQAKQMMLPMSIFMAVMLYGLPSGLCLYISASSFLGFFEQRYLKKKMGIGGPGGQEEQEKAAPKSPPKPQPPAERKSMVSGRDKSLGERVEVWLRNLLTPPEAKRGDDDRRGKGKRK